jgi:uracil-DNA glycosylase family 4
MSPCPTCPCLRGPIPPSGPSPCSILLLGEAPHKTEDRTRIPFSGPTGKELDHYYLPHAGLFRSDVHVTNAQLCSLHLYRNPSPGEALACAQHHLPVTISQVSPDIIVPMGAVACSLFRLQGNRAINLELHHGRPLLASLVLDSNSNRPIWTGPILPLYHPSAGIHDSNTRYLLQQDFPVLKTMIRDQVDWTTIRKQSETDYARIKGPLELDCVLLDMEQLGDGWLAIDTETDCQGFELDPMHDPPYCLSFSGRPHTGYVLMAEDFELLSRFNAWITRRRPRIVLHNSLFDVPVLERMGITLPGPDGLWPLVHDTLLDAYHTGWMPQGLKVLAYRELGVEMTDYEDTVNPHVIGPQVSYLLRVAQDKNIPQPYLKPRQWKLHRKAMSLVEKTLEGKIKGIAVTPPQTKIRDNWQPEDIWTMEEHFGRFPYSSIRMAPLEETVRYAARDADVTYRLRPVLADRKRRVRVEAGA